MDSSKHLRMGGDRFVNSMKAHHPDLVPEEEALDLLSEDEVKPLLRGFKVRHPEYFGGKKGSNGDKAPETAQESSQTPDAHKGADQAPESQPSAPGAAEASLFPPVDDGEKARYEDLVKTAKGLGIYPEAKAGQLSLNRLIRECWTDKPPSVEIWQIPVEVYDRVDARLTEIVQATKK